MTAHHGKMNHGRDDTSELLDTIQRQAKELTELRAALEAELCLLKS